MITIQLFNSTHSIRLRLSNSAIPELNKKNSGGVRNISELWDAEAPQGYADDIKALAIANLYR